MGFDHRISAGLLAVLGVAMAVTGAEAAPRRAAKPATLVACPFTIPDEVNAPLGADDDSDDSDDDDDDDDDGAPGNPGWKTASGGCLIIGGSVDAGMQGTYVGGLPPGTGRSAPRLSYSPSSSFTVAYALGGAPTDLTARLELDAVPGSLTLSQASVTMGGLTAGMETSYFDAWAGDEFTFRALAPSQSPTLIGWTSRPADTVALSVSLEDPTFRRVTVSGYGPSVLPDPVARFRWVSGDWDVTATAAAQQVRLPDPQDKAINGYAMLASVKRALPFGDDTYVIAQAGYARNALGFLGVANTSSTFFVPLPGVLGAAVAERGTGYSAALVGQWSFAEKWRTAAFVSAVSLDLPRTRGDHTVTSARGAVNVTFSPVENFDITLEFGASRLTSGIPLVPNLRQQSIIALLSRTF